MIKCAKKCWSRLKREIEQVSADGADAKRKCEDAINECEARAAIAPRQHAQIWPHANTDAERLVRDENLRQIRKFGRKAWKQESGDDQRSLAETAMFRASRRSLATVSRRASLSLKRQRCLSNAQFSTA